MSSRIRFKSFSSGSCGNCYFLGIEEDGKICASVLIDAGVSMRRVKAELSREKIGIEDIGCILVTHDHLDHIRSLGSFCKKMKLPVWTSPELHYALSHHTFTSDYIAPCKRILENGKDNEVIPGKVSVRYFVVPHDATQTIGFRIALGDYIFTIITDCGKFTEESLDCAREAQTVVIESNYDPQMLANGPYPAELKKRISNGHGHSSNEECAKAIEKIIHPELKNIFLCHLSENNNTPQLALRESSKVTEGEKVRLLALPRQSASPLFIL